MISKNLNLIIFITNIKMILIIVIKITLNNSKKYLRYLTY